nr:reverse transcriptase domain-containing protein [Tanacetum cinerariifolium]
MDDEPIWVADHVVTPTLGSAIIIPETADEFAIKGNHLTLVKGNQFDGRTKTADEFAIKGNNINLFYHGLSEITQEVLNAAGGGIFLYKTPNQAYQLLEDKVLPKLDWAKNKKTNPSLKKTVAFADEGRSNSDTNKIMARMDAMTLKIDAQYKELQSNAKKAKPDLDEDDIPMSCEEEAKFMQTFPDLGASINLMPYSLYAKLSLETLKPTKMSVRLADRSFQYPVGITENMRVEVGKFTFPIDFVILEMEEDSKVPLILGRPFLHSADVVNRVKHKQLNLGVGTKRMIFNIDSTMKHSYSNDYTCLSIDVINEILEEDFDALLDEGSKILHSIEGTYLEKEILAEFDEFMAMTADENFGFESDAEEPPFEKITINTDYKIKTSLEEPPMDLELKPLPDDIEYVFLEEPAFLSIIVSIFQIPINPNDKEKTTFICPFGTYAYSFKALIQETNAKPHLIHWILLLQEFDIEIKNRKGTENATAEHLSRIENDKLSDDSEVDDNFPEETLMEINTKDEPWFADFANYLVGDIIPKGMTYQQRINFPMTSNTTFGKNLTFSKYVLTDSTGQQSSKKLIL